MSILLSSVLLHSAINFNNFYHQRVFSTNPSPSDFYPSLGYVICWNVIKILSIFTYIKEIIILTCYKHSSRRNEGL